MPTALWGREVKPYRVPCRKTWVSPTGNEDKYDRSNGIILRNEGVHMTLLVQRQCGNILVYYTKLKGTNNGVELFFFKGAMTRFNAVISVLFR